MKIPHAMTWAFWAHEPIQFYRRRHADIHSIIGNGRWIDKWYDRIHSEEAIAKAADMGVNFIYTHFYKGFGFEFEKEEMLRTAEVVRLGHKYGMKVLGYCTIGTFYPETLAEELPDALSCSRIKPDGTPYHPLFEGGFNCRNFVCYNSELYFGEYYHNILKHGIQVTGLDGFHFDNASGSLACHCPRCLASFRKYLEENAGDPKQYALKSWNHISFPVNQGPLEPVNVLWMRCRREETTRLHTRVFKQVKALDPEAIVLYNPGWGRFSFSGFEPVDAPAEADMTFIETPSVIRIDEKTGEHITAVSSYKLADLAGKKALNTSWLQNEYSLRTPENEEEVTRILAEHMVYGHDCGANWLTRPLKKGDAMKMDQPVHYDNAKQIFTYFQTHPELYVDVQPCSKVKLLYSRDTRLLLPDEHKKGVDEAADTLRKLGIPWEYILPGSPAPEADETVIIPRCLVLSDADGEKIAKWPCKILSIADGGILDDMAIEREEPLFPETGLSGLPPGFKTNMEHALFETARAADGSLLLHIINMDNAHTLPEVTVSLPFHAGTCSVYSYEKAVTADLTAPDLAVIRNLKTLCTLKFTLEEKY